MKASDLDKEPSHPEMPTAREWLRVVGAAVATRCASAPCGPSGPDGRAARFRSNRVVPFTWKPL